MEGSNIIDRENISLKHKPGAGLLKHWAGLFIGLLIIWLLMAYAAPWGRQTETLRPIMDVIEERGIEATAYYYTDMEEFAEAEINITHALRYPPMGPAGAD
ncbi:MAG: hypothetical protein AB1427_08620 [Thermodesulfobacteriota bacterium]